MVLVKRGRDHVVKAFYSGKSMWTHQSINSPRKVRACYLLKEPPTMSTAGSNQDGYQNKINLKPSQCLSVLQIDEKRTIH